MKTYSTSEATAMASRPDIRVNLLCFAWLLDKVLVFVRVGLVFVECLRGQMTVCHFSLSQPRRVAWFSVNPSMLFWVC